MRDKYKNIESAIIEKTKDGDVYYNVFSRLVKDRIIFLSDEIDAEVATTIAATMFYLDHQDCKKDITLYINTPGGTVSDGLLTIYDTMQFIKSPVKTICIGEAYSAGAVVLASGSPGKRLAFPNAKVMIHGLQIGGLRGSAVDIAIEAAEIARQNIALAEILARHTGKPIEQVLSDIKTDRYLTAQEALDYGLIDAIVSPSKQIPKLISESIIALPIAKVLKIPTKKAAIKPKRVNKI